MTTLSPDSIPLGLIGLGLMGVEIAQRLQLAGHALIGFDVSPERSELARSLDVAMATNAQLLWKQCDIILLSLPDDRITQEVINAATLRSGQTIIDTTTGRAEASAALADQCAAQGVEYIDATVSGSSAHLRAGSAVIMAGATELGWSRVHRILLAMAPGCFHVGPPGAGARMKLVTNLVLGLNRAALAEGLAFAQVQGLDLHLTLQMLQATPAYSRIMDTKGAKMIQRDFTPQARLAQHLKDVLLMLQCAAEHHLELPLTNAHRQLLQAAVALGHGQSDNSALITAYGSGTGEGPLLKPPMD